MPTITNTNIRPPNSVFSTIIKAGLLVGTLDICLAFLNGYIKNGITPFNILQYISKVAFPAKPGGPAGNPAMLTITGLLVHFAIAMCWTILFFILYRWLNLVRLNKIATGIVYGLLVWAMMSIVILPWWNNRPFVFKADTALINALILIVAIGLPLSFIAKRFYSKKFTSAL